MGERIGRIGSALFLLGIVWGLTLGTLIGVEYFLLGAAIASAGIFIVAGWGEVEDPEWKYGTGDEPWTEEQVDEFMNAMEDEDSNHE